MELENNDIDLTDESLNVSLSEEEIQKIESASLEELFEGLDQIEDTVADVEGEEAPIDDLGPAMESLMGMMDEIRHSGGISRSDAATLMGMTSSMEGFQDTFRNLPLTSFTEVPSKVNYDVSMENVVGNVIKKIIEAIKRAIKWLKDKVTSAWKWVSGSSANSKKAEAITKKVVAEVKNVPPPTEAKLTKTANDVVAAKTKAKTKDGFDKSLEEFVEDALKLDKVSKVEAKVVKAAIAADPEVKPKDIVKKIVETESDKLAKEVRQIMFDIMDTDVVDKVAALSYSVEDATARLLNGDTHNAWEYITQLNSAIAKFTGGKQASVDYGTKGNVPTSGFQDIDYTKIDTIGRDILTNLHDAVGPFQKSQNARVDAKLLERPLEVTGKFTEYVKRNGQKNHEITSVYEKMIMVHLDTLSKIVKKAEAGISKLPTSGSPEDMERLAAAKGFYEFLHSYVSAFLMTVLNLVRLVGSTTARMSKIAYDTNARTVDSLFG